MVVVLREQLVHESRSVWVLHDQTLLLQGVIEHLALDGPHAAHMKLLAHYEALHDHELLLVHRDDEDAILFPRLATLGYDLTDGHVLDFNLFTEGVNLEVAGHVLDCCPDDDLAQLDELLLGDEALLAELHDPERLGLFANEALVADAPRP